jgi:hypothetical protein
VKPEEKKKELQKDAEVLKMLEEDEDDFEEFEEGGTIFWDVVYDETAPVKIDAKQWREDWDDEDINDEFGIQLRKELGIPQQWLKVYSYAMLSIVQANQQWVDNYNNLHLNLIGMEKDFQERLSDMRDTHRVKIRR